MLYFVLAALLTAADQLSKYLVRANIPLGGSVTLIPHVMDLTYCQNTGAAFSIFRTHTWLLALISAVVSAALAVVLARKMLVRRPAGRICLAVVLAGAVGNLIDRAAFGYVTDMFKTTFMDFAIFNVADICVVLGGIGFCIYFLFFYDRLEGREKEQTNGSGPSDG